MVEIQKQIATRIAGARSLTHGSAAVAPKAKKHFVQYKDYDERDTVAGKDIKPPYDWKTAKKRKAEEELALSVLVNHARISSINPLAIKSF